VLFASTRVAPLACQSRRRLGDRSQPVVVSAPDTAAQAFVMLPACVAEHLLQEGLARYIVEREPETALVLET